jgi:NADH-quinone oxidoreductase subunit J
MFAAIGSVPETLVWIVAATICLLGSVGVVGARNPVYSALSLVATLFGVAVLFVAQGAYFLAAIQVMVYAGAIVVLFLFVIMLIGVDRHEDVWFDEQRPWRRPVAMVVGVALCVGVLLTVLWVATDITGTKSTTAPLEQNQDLAQLGRALFTRYVFAFEITAVLLTIAVVGAVALSRKLPKATDLAEFGEEEDDDDLLQGANPALVLGDGHHQRNPIEARNAALATPSDLAVESDLAPESELAADSESAPLNESPAESGSEPDPGERADTDDTPEASR